ncbi:alkaline phosphatase D family protein [Prauserella cavernicola]|uniref:Alkaline phosphatase D family protein n=1 Tax=Prauserella cavernicola TaxID=2800127 RepID=A0A934V8F2_9PSEU|nr:alkaline phosphatase D family protein [Prauserella cavernicola]MBK1788230.1 alkaline phosphatase D family protein [Prauserella cavernicola]
MAQVNRRLVLLGGVAAAAGAVTLPTSLPAWARSRTAASAPAIRDPFQLGVASGDPLPDSVVLWTRLAPAPLNEDGFGGMPDAAYDVEWELATDENFGSVVQNGTVSTSRAMGHSVHVEPEGLEAGRDYFYRFRTEGHLSPAGRTRTAPAADSAVDSLTYCFTSCQHWEEGWYHAHRGIADDDPDLVLFLGDYIYEKPSGREPELKVRGLAVTDETTTLALYRARYGQHKTDSDLQAAHAAAPWLVVFDDHEVVNNWNSTSSPAGTQRKEEAFQAFYENMPIRSSAVPDGAKIQLYRRFQWGQLARFHLLDTRQHRDAQAEDDSCSVMRDPDRTITGSEQEKWLLDAFATQPSTWDFLGQQVFFAQRDGDGDKDTCDDTDAWDGYEGSRDRITQGWVDAGVPNMVVLTGDVHRHWAADLRQDYFDHDSAVVGSELVTTSVSSTSAGAEPPSEQWLANNPHIKYCQGERGYVRVTATSGELKADFRVVSDALEQDPAKVEITTDASYVVEAGTPGLKPA